MSDNELRNQHARHYAGHGYAVGIKNESFKAGWNAAREQEPMVIYKLEKERDQLRAEIDKLKQSVEYYAWKASDNSLQMDEVLTQNLNLKAQCEKLAEALKPVSECGNCGGCRDKARQALAEYRKANKC